MLSLRRDRSVSRHTIYLYILELGQSVSHILMQKMACLLLGKGLQVLKLNSEFLLLRKKIIK